MSIRISALGRVFAPSWPLTLLTLILLALFVGLGRWQWHRGVAKQAVWAQFERDSPAQALGTREFAVIDRFARIGLTGRYESDRQFLLDNRSHKGQPGYEVLTPFLLADGRRVLVNRGWIPFDGYRERLPDVTMSTVGETQISGRVEQLPSGGLKSGHATPDPTASWPKLTSFPTHAELAHALGMKLEQRMLLLDGGMPQGFVREWSPPGMPPTRHFSYAIQWWGFAGALLVLYFGLNLRKVS